MKICLRLWSSVFFSFSRQANSFLLSHTVANRTSMGRGPRFLFSFVLEFCPSLLAWKYVNSHFNLFASSTTFLLTSSPSSSSTPAITRLLIFSGDDGTVFGWLGSCRSSWLILSIWSFSRFISESFCRFLFWASLFCWAVFVFADSILFSIFSTLSSMSMIRCASGASISFFKSFIDSRMTSFIVCCIESYIVPVPRGCCFGGPSRSSSESQGLAISVSSGLMFVADIYFDSESLLIIGLSVCGENPSSHSLKPRLLSDWDAVAYLVAMLPRPPRFVYLGDIAISDFLSWILRLFVISGGFTLCQFGLWVFNLLISTFF